MVFNATYNIIFQLYRDGQFFFMVEETGVPGKNHTPATSYQETLSHSVALSTPRHWRN